MSLFLLLGGMQRTASSEAESFARNWSPLSDSKAEGQPHEGTKQFFTSLLVVPLSVVSAAVTAHISSVAEAVDKKDDV